VAIRISAERNPNVSVWRLGAGPCDKARRAPNEASKTLDIITFLRFNLIIFPLQRLEE
jgi:hypothetical protein